MKILAIFALFSFLGLTQGEFITKKKRCSNCWITYDNFAFITARSTPYKYRSNGKGGIVGVLTGPTSEEINVTMNLPSNVDVLGTFTGVTRNSDEFRFNALEAESPEIILRERAKKESDERSKTHQNRSNVTPNLIIKREDSKKSSNMIRKLRSRPATMPDKDKVIDEIEKTTKSAMGLLNAIKNYAIESLHAGTIYGINPPQDKINYPKNIGKFRQRVVKDHPCDDVETDGNLDVSPSENEGNEESSENVDPNRSALATKNFVVGLGLGLKLGAQMSGQTIEYKTPDNLLNILSNTPI